MLIQPSTSNFQDCDSPIPVCCPRERLTTNFMRRQVWLLLVLAIHFACPPGAAVSSVAEVAATPNLVIFISDDHGYSDTSLNGALQFRTPNLQRIARAGMTFTHAFAASPSCAPSRAALLTGLMPVRIGAMLNHEMLRSSQSGLVLCRRKAVATL
jgi:hypothetical protein